MALPTVTAAMFKARYPIFEEQADALVDLVLEEAQGAVDEDWITADIKPAMMAFAAHLLASDGYAYQSVDIGGGQSVPVVGPAQVAKVGDVMVKFGSDAAAASDGGGSGSSWLDATTYGQRYLALLRRSKPAVIVA